MGFGIFQLMGNSSVRDGLGGMMEPSLIGRPEKASVDWT
jgi:hypothetical protein